MATNELRDLYHKLILEHSNRPRNLNKINNPTLDSQGVNPFCGDEVRIQIDLDPSESVIHIGVQAVGCTINKASSSILSELVENKPLTEATTLSLELRKSINTDHLSSNPLIKALSGVKNIPIRAKCALLSWSILDELIEKYQPQNVHDCKNDGLAEDIH